MTEQQQYLLFYNFVTEYLISCQPDFSLKWIFRGFCNLLVSCWLLTFYLCLPLKRKFLRKLFNIVHQMSLFHGCNSQQSLKDEVWNLNVHEKLVAKQKMWVNQILLVNEEHIYLFSNCKHTKHKSPEDLFFFCTTGLKLLKSNVSKSVGCIPSSGP